MSLQPPSYQIPIVDDQQRATPQFLKFLADLGNTAPGSVQANVATLQTQVATLITDMATVTASLAALTTIVGGHTSHLNLLPTSRLKGTATYNPPNLLTLGTATTTVTVVGAALGMACEASFSLDTQDIMLDADVQSSNTVAVTFFNPTAGAIDLASGTLTVYVWTP